MGLFGGLRKRMKVDHGETPAAPAEFAAAADEMRWRAFLRHLAMADVGPIEAMPAPLRPPPALLPAAGTRLPVQRRSRVEPTRIEPDAAPGTVPDTDRLIGPAAGEETSSRLDDQWLPADDGRERVDEKRAQAGETIQEAGTVPIGPSSSNHGRLLRMRRREPGGIGSLGLSSLASDLLLRRRLAADRNR
jgi:hypothetical protein